MLHKAIHRRVIGGRRTFRTSELHRSRRADVASARSLKGEDQGWVLTGFAFSSGRTPGALHFFPIYLFPTGFQRTTVVASILRSNTSYLESYRSPLSFSVQVHFVLMKLFQEKNSPACPHIPPANLGYGSTEPVCTDSFLGLMEAQDGPLQ